MMLVSILEKAARSPFYAYTITRATEGSHEGGVLHHRLIASCLRAVPAQFRTKEVAHG